MGGATFDVRRATFNVLRDRFMTSVIASPHQPSLPLQAKVAASAFRVLHCALCIVHCPLHVPAYGPVLPIDTRMSPAGRATLTRMAAC